MQKKTSKKDKDCKTCTKVFMSTRKQRSIDKKKKKKMKKAIKESFDDALYRVLRELHSENVNINLADRMLDYNKTKAMVMQLGHTPDDLTEQEFFKLKGKPLSDVVQFLNQKRVASAGKVGSTTPTTPTVQRTPINSMPS